MYTFLEKGVYPDSDRLGTARSLCSGQKYMLDPTASWCSGTLIAPDRIITAGHCVNAVTCVNVAFLFNYYVIGRDSSGYPMFPAITADDIYTCRSVKQLLVTNIDYAVVHLDRPVTSSRHSPAAISTAATAVTFGQSLTMIGFPSGLPAKIDSGGTVTTTRSSTLDYFQGTTDSFGGNSGSGVFDSSRTQVGILVRGATDYVASGSCNVVNVISTCTSNCGEDITYAYQGPAAAPDCTSNSQCASGETCYRTCASTSSACTGFCTASISYSSRGTVSCGQTVTGTTTGASNIIGNDAGDAFYQFTTTTTSTVSFNGCASSYDTVMRVLSSDLTVELGYCDDCGCSSSASKVTVTLNPGTYVVVIEGYQSSTGSYSMTVTCSAASSSPSPTKSTVVAVSPSPSSSIVASSSQSQSSSVSRIVSPSAVASVTSSPSIAVSPSNSRIPSPSSVPSQSASSSRIPSPSSVPSPTSAASITASGSRLPSPSNVPSISSSTSRIPSNSAASSLSSTATPSPSQANVLNTCRGTTLSLSTFARSGLAVRTASVCAR
eukprot:c7385_g1_i1.p1 GENE.c7385_g1_i1~~c7385_g1_i1.p1  ORF type:complete len:617 (-),score=143.82 c7385_g1_i1:37-1683(-)